MYIGGTEILNLIIALIGILSCANMLFFRLITGQAEKVTTTYVVFAVISLLTYNICLFALVLLQNSTVILSDKYHWKVITILMGFGTFLYSNVTAYIVSRYVAHLVNPPEQNHKRIRIALASMLVLYFVILLIMQSTGNLVQVDEAGTYSEGEYSFAGYVMVASFMLFDLVTLIRFRKNVSLYQRMLIWLYIGVPVFAILIRGFFKGVYIVALASTLSVSCFMILSLIEKAKEYHQQERKNEQLKVDILLGQIQPHFMFNVLYVIQEICLINPEKASYAIGEFSKYLRHNMDSMSLKTLIPFSSELEHTKHYIYLQQLRFGEALAVEYELGCTEFDMPTLTLQPIVENAVRYGVRRTNTGEGTVIIRTEEYPDRYEVKVTDNGPGFDPNEKKEDGLTHTGLNNVRERLQRICDGKLEILSEPGKGTTVTIILPKKQ